MWQPIAGVCRAISVKRCRSSFSLLTVRRMSDQLSLIIQTLQHTGHPPPVLSSPTSQSPSWIFHPEIHLLPTKEDSGILLAWLQTRPERLFNQTTHQDQTKKQ